MRWSDRGREPARRLGPKLGRRSLIGNTAKRPLRVRRRCGLGFSIWVADDPELADAFAASDYPHLSLTRHQMVALRRAMAAQGLALARDFDFNDGTKLGSREIDEGIAAASTEATLTLRSPEEIEL